MTAPSSAQAPGILKSPFAISAISGHLDTRTAATEVADTLFDELGANAQGVCDLALMFGSFHHRAAFDAAAEIVRSTISPGVLLGVTAEAVLGHDQELEGLAGLSVIAMRLPGVRLHPWYSTPDDPIPLSAPEKVRQRIGLDGDDAADFRAAIMLADPFTTPITRLLPALTSCGEEAARPSETEGVAAATAGLPVVVIGGMASGSNQPGMNVLVRDNVISNAGAIGVSIFGDVEIDFIVSQGCRPIGKPLVITKCNQNVVLELGGRKAIEVLQELAQSLSEAEKRLLSRGLLVGSVINEYKDHFGRGDFLVRNVMGFDQRVGGVAIGEMCRVGQTIQFHVRDAATAEEDLQLLLDAQVMNNKPPFGALLFTCNGRGQRLFNEPNHDLNIIRERVGPVPIAGFFAAGEIGPIGNRSFLHGHTASLALLRGRE